MFDQIRSLHESGLWTNLSSLGTLLLVPSWSSSSSSSFSSPLHSDSSLTPRQIVQIQIMIADAFFEVKEYRRAENLYKEASQCKKHFLKAKNRENDGKIGENEENNETSAIEMTSDVEVKYKMHLCYLNTQQPTQAFNVLQSIPAKQRSPKVNMALGRLYQQAGMERPAVTCYKEVLKACPLAIEAATILMQLGVKAKEIQSLTLELSNVSSCSSSSTSVSSNNGLEWFHSWIQASSLFANREYTQAISAYKQLEDKYSPALRNNVNILVSIGQAQFYNGDFNGATVTLQRVHKIDPFHLRGMDILASLLAKEKRLKDLEMLAKKLMSISEEAPEPWTAMGYYCYLNKKGTRAVYFAHKACILQHRSIEALLLKGNLLLDLKKLQDAMNHFREAIQLAPHRYECHKGLVDCYMGQSRHREAVSVATAACKQLNNSPRALTLYASVLIKDPLQLFIPRAKSMLEKALAADPCYLPAVYLLAELLEQEINYDQAISLLKKQLSMQTTCKLHQMLADLLAKTHDEEKAMEHYGIALNLDPKNLPAQEGLQKIEQATDTPMDATYDMDMEEMNSDEADLEESETEAVWSDGDLNLATSGSAARSLN